MTLKTKSGIEMERYDENEVEIEKEWRSVYWS